MPSESAHPPSSSRHGAQPRRAAPRRTTHAATATADDAVLLALTCTSVLRARYYFALRALTEQKSFRQRYNSTMTQAPHMEKVQQRTVALKKDIGMLFSKSL